MNTFEHRLYIDDKLYNIYVDSSVDEYKRIVINNRELVNEKYTLALNRKAYIIYYPIALRNNELIISIDDNSLAHTYNLYLNNVSVLDGSRIDEKYSRANSILEKGFISFVKSNWFKILITNLLSMLGSIFSLALLFNYTMYEFKVKFILVFIIVPLLLPAFVMGEWFHNKDIVKKYKGCFRPKVNMDDRCYGSKWDM